MRLVWVNHIPNVPAAKLKGQLIGHSYLADWWQCLLHPEDDPT
jgi:hypothetical protein